ncbi:MAG: c-type cytochrome [Planctomycetaceae bacterium]|nr:c-type cytochrome [Planctomycetaceae bacterium]
MPPAFARLLAATVTTAILVSGAGADESLERRLQTMPSAEIEAHVRLHGDPRRGALLFYKSAAACSRCHASGSEVTPLGPNLATIGPDASVQHIVESLLEPSRKIRKGFETVSIVTTDGRVLNGLIARQDAVQLVLRDATNLLQEVVVARSDIDEMRTTDVSMMPQGLIASLRDEREFYDLVRYVRELAVGGAARAAELQPSAEELVVVDDTLDLDHARILAALGEKDFKAGRETYLGHCVNCHGSDGNTPKLPTARAFGRDALKYGADPYRMFLTVSRGAGLMAPLSHLSPKERYQVVYYVREALMKGRNPDYQAVDEAYLAGLPQGAGLGEQEESGDRDYGPVLGSQLGNQVNNGLTFRLTEDVSVCYDLHRMRFAAAWQGGFLDLSQTHHYRQRGERMPQIRGDEIPALSQWAWELNGSFDLPADAKPPRGPVRNDWLQYHGYDLHGDRAILSYGIHGREVLESIAATMEDRRVSLIHTLRVGPGDRPLRLAVAQLASTGGPSGLVDALTGEIHPFDEPSAGAVAVITGQSALRDVPKPHPNQARHVIAGKAARDLDLGTTGRTTLVRFRSDDSGTLIASTPLAGVWQPNGKSLFLRGGRLVYDIGWVGAMTSQTAVADGKWHVAALVVDDAQTRLYIDGRLEAERKGFRREPVDAFVLKIGATATNFGGDLDGDVDWVRILDRAWTTDEVGLLGRAETPPDGPALLAWAPGAEDSPPVTVSASVNWGLGCAAKVLDDVDGLVWSHDDAGRLTLTIPPSSRDRQFRVVRSTAANAEELKAIRQQLAAIADDPPLDLSTATHGGPQRWPQLLEFAGRLGEPVNGYALDTIPVPFENPWNAWLRTSALDFLDDGRCVVTTHGGDVYLVSGVDKSLSHVTWKRFAAGLFEPFGVRVVDGTIYVTCRDGLKRLHDFNGDDEADYVEAFWADDDVSCSFHAYNFDLQTDSAGNFYFAKAGQYTQHHRPGTIMRVPLEGGRAEVVAWGLRTPNGMGRLADDRFTVSDNQGPWMPAGKISLIRPGSFLGNMPINDEQTEWLKLRHGGTLPETFDEPIVWTPQELDNSCGGQVWVDDPRFGPLSGRLLHSSFGKGWLYAMSLQEVGAVMQGAIVALPHQWDAGVMRLRVNPADGQLYGTGLSGWQGPAGGHDGCLQRLRYTGDDVQMIDRVQVDAEGIELTFTFPIDPESACDPAAYEAEMWDYLWSQRYGSDQFSVRNPGQPGHDGLTIERVRQLSERSVKLVIPDLAVCDQLRLHMLFRDASPRPFAEQVYLTIHAIPGN